MNEKKAQPFKIFESEKELQKFLDQNLEIEKNKFNQLNHNFQNLEKQLVNFENLKKDFENLNLEKSKWKNNFETIIKKEWENMPVQNKNLDWNNFDYSNIDVNNLKKSLIKFADDNNYLIKQNQTDIKEFEVKKSSLFIDSDKGVIF